MLRCACTAALTSLWGIPFFWIAIARRLFMYVTGFSALVACLTSCSQRKPTCRRPVACTGNAGACKGVWSGSPALGGTSGR